MKMSAPILVINVCFVFFSSCFPTMQQSKKSPADDTMESWTPYEKYAGRNNEIVLGAYRSVNKLNPNYAPAKKEGGDIGALQLIFRNKKTTTEEKYYLLQCINDTDTAFMRYGLKYTYTEDQPAIISHPRTRETNMINESYVVSGAINTTLNDNIWNFVIGPYAMELKSKVDSSYFERISGYVDKNHQSTISPIPISVYTSPLLKEGKQPPSGISFVDGGRHLAAMKFSSGNLVLMKKNAPKEYRLIIAAICSAMYDLKKN